MFMKYENYEDFLCWKRIGYCQIHLIYWKVIIIACTLKIWTKWDIDLNVKMQYYLYENNIIAMKEIS